MTDQLHQFTKHYLASPPVHQDKTTGQVVRHSGSYHRAAFWAGYDLVKGGVYGPDKTAVGAAYRAGQAYRKQVDAGRLAPLPTK